MSLLDRLNKASSQSVNADIVDKIKKTLGDNSYIHDIEFNNGILTIMGNPHKTRPTVSFCAWMHDLTVFTDEQYSKYIKQIQIEGVFIFYTDEHIQFNPNIKIIADNIFFRTDSRRVVKMEGLNCKCNKIEVLDSSIRVANSYIECEKLLTKNDRNILPSTIKKYIK
nr:MAG TPA: hypothetical protein [Caudoviricetes sp.]